MTKATAARRTLRLEHFDRWLVASTGGWPSRALSREHPVIFAESVVEYGKLVFEARWSRGDFAETVNALQHAFHWAAASMSGARRLLGVWEKIEPSTVRRPVPYPVLAALVGTSLAWGWVRLCSLILIGFYALLRLAELLGVRWSDLSFPLDHHLGPVLFVRLRSPKTRYRGPRQQAVKIADALVVNFLLRARGLCSTCDLIWPASVNLFRKRFRLVSDMVTQVPRLITPACLRPGGATFFFSQTHDDVLRTLWHGRWVQPKMLAHYLQELQSTDVLASLSPLVRRNLDTWMSLYEPLLKEGPS